MACMGFRASDNVKMADRARYADLTVQLVELRASRAQLVEQLCTLRRDATEAREIASRERDNYAHEFNEVVRALEQDRITLAEQVHTRASLIALMMVCLCALGLYHSCAIIGLPSRPTAATNH